MAIGRSLTSRFARAELGFPMRSRSTKEPRLILKPGLISLPTQLISSSNLLAYEAPDIQSSNMTSENATPSFVDSTSSTSPSSPPSLTDASSAGSSPIEHNHLSCYFPGPTLKRAESTRIAVANEEAAIPQLPKRMLSHSRHEHERLARKRSIRSSNGSANNSPRMSHDGFNDGSASPKSDVSATTCPRSASPPFETASNTFCRELEQLNEVAEEVQLAIRSLEDEQDKKIMRKRGLSNFSADDYVNEIASLLPLFLGDAVASKTSPDWI